MKSTFSKPATLAALALCVVFSIILVNRIAGALGGSASHATETVSGLELLPGDAALTGMIEVRQTLDDGVFGLNSENLFPAKVNSKVNHALESIEEFSGVNPATDIERILFSFSRLEDDADPVLLAQGNFDRDAMISFLDEKAGHELQQNRYRGEPTYSLGDASELFLAFPSNNLVIATRFEADLEKTLDRLNKDLPRTVINDGAFGPVAGTDAWVSVNSIQNYVSRMVSHSEIDERVDLARRAVAGIMVGIDAEDDRIVVRSALTPVESVSTSDLEDIVKGLLAAARTASRDHPDNPVVADVIDRIKVRKSGEHVVVSIEVDRRDLEQVLQSIDETH